MEIKDIMTSPENNMLVAVQFREYITPGDMEITAFFINNLMYHVEYDLVV